MLIIGLIISSILILAVLAASVRNGTQVVAEDHVAVTVNRNGFIKRVLPAGRHVLAPFERIELTLPLKISLAKGWGTAVATSDGIPLKINWSGTYALRPELITENRSQRLRGLPNAENGIARNVDLCLRRMVGNYTVRDMFNPALRERLERQLSQLLADKLTPLGIAFNSINLQTIELPPEVADAFSKAKAIETLDGTIRHLDPTTREVVRGAYRLDEILRWEQYFPVPVRKPGAAATTRN
jgi:regulator of protease activity HflC (stomatin/prohibitin superfamily)